MKKILLASLLAVGSAASASDNDLNAFRADVGIGLAGASVATLGIVKYIAGPIRFC